MGTAASGCTPVAWQHASLGVAPSQAEVTECNQSAYLEAQRQAFFYSFARPPYYYAGRPGWYRPWPRYAANDSFFLERDLFDYCMRAKGYRLVEVSTATPDE